MYVDFSKIAYRELSSKSMIIATLRGIGMDTNQHIDVFEPVVCHDTIRCVGTKKKIHDGSCG